MLKKIPFFKILWQGWAFERGSLEEFVGMKINW